MNCWTSDFGYEAFGLRRLLGLRKSRAAKRFPARGGRHSFVLMEVLVSVTIMAVGITVLLQSIINSLEANQITRNFTRGVFLAEGKMWELENEYGYMEDMPTGPSYGEFDPPFHDYTWEAEVSAEEDLVEYRIEVTVKWIHRKREKEYTLRTVVPMRREERDLKI